MTAVEHSAAPSSSLRMRANQTAAGTKEREGSGTDGESKKYTSLHDLTSDPVAAIICRKEEGGVGLLRFSKRC